MGFRFKRFDYVGGVAPWTGGTSTADQVTRSQAVCKDFADFIIACGKGWQLDTARNATTSDFVSVPIWGVNGTVQSFSAPGLFFTNSVSGCKLFLCVAGFNSSYGIALDNDYLLHDIAYTGSSKIIYNGIIISVIPSGSANDFGSSFDSTFLPQDATVIYGTTYQSGGGSYLENYVSENTASTNYSYGVFVDSYCLGIGGGYNSSSVPTINIGAFVGRVIGTLAHEETTNQARYGVIKFSDSYGNGAAHSEFGVKAKPSSNSNYGCPFSSALNTGSSAASKSATCDGAFFKADGSRIDGRDGANIRYFAHTAASISQNSNLFSAVLSGASRWVPFEAGVVSSDLSTNGIATGDGFKGYLDTELFRSSQVNLNQLYNDGTFIGADATYNLMIGWDPSNTDSL